MLESFLSDFSFIKETLDKEGDHNFFGRDFSFFSTEPILFYHSDKDAIVYMNSTFTKEFNYSVEDLSSWKYSIYPLLNNEDQEPFRQAMKALLESDGEYPPDANYRLIAKDKKHSYYRVKVRKLHKGYYFIQLENSVKSAIPVLKNKTADELMQEAEGILKFGFWMWDVVTDKLFWTKGMYHLLGYDDMDDVTPTRSLLTDLIMKDEHYLEFEKRLQENQLKESYRLKYQLKTTKGNIITVSEHGRVENDEHGKIIRVVGLTRDISIQEQSMKGLAEYEKILENKIEELNKSNLELEEFAYVASHDMQEPLRKISTFGQRLQTNFSDKLGNDGNMFLSRMLGASENMRKLIDNLLEFSKVSRNKQPYEEIDLNRILNEVLDDLDMRIAETDAEISVDPPLPVIEAIPSQMRQLFFNLLQNAIKFRKKDTKLVIKITNRELNDIERKTYQLTDEHTYFMITVSDNGIGFEQQYAERIFQLFQRLEGKSEYPGTGIGLSICRKIVTNHSGLIFAESEPAKGTLFSIILPQDQ